MASEKTVKVPFAVEQRRTFRGRRLNKYNVQLAECQECVEADSSQELQEKVAELIRSRLQRPQIALVRAGEELRVLVGWNEGVETYRPVKQDEEGVVMLTCTCYSPRADLKTEAEQCCRHLAQMQETDGTGDVPAWLPVSQVADFQKWQEFLRETLAARQ